MDVALLKINKKCPNKSLLIGKSLKVKVGQTIFVIGNSNGEGLRLTSGIISDKRIVYSA